MTSEGLVRELAEIMIEGVDTHPEWAETLAAMIVGTMLGKKRYIFNNYGKLYGNIMSIYVGASGLSVKTVPLKKVVRPLLKRLTDYVNRDTLESVYGMTRESYALRRQESKTAASRTKGTTAWKEENAFLGRLSANMVDFEAPSVFTNEALITHLNQFPQCTIVGDEYTQMFKGTSTKDYLSANMEMLSKLYDSEMDKVRTQARGVEYPEDAYCGFVSATTYYLLTLMNDDFFIQGTGNRIMWILDLELNEVDVEEEAADMGFFWKAGQEILYEENISQAARDLMNIKLLPEGIVVFQLDASIEMDRYRLRQRNRAVRKFTIDILDKDANLIARLAQNAMKLAMIHCIGRYALEERGSVVNTMQILPKDVKWATEKMDRHYKYYLAMQEIAARLAPTTTRQYKNDQERILYVLSRLNRRGQKMTVSDLARQTGWLNKDCKILLDTMVANDILDTKEAIRAETNRRFVYYDYKLVSK